MGGHKALFLHSEDLETFGYPESCPFSTKRAGLARKKLESIGMLSPEEIYTPAAISRRTISKFHPLGYLDLLEKAETGDLGVELFAIGLGTPETPIFRGMVAYAMLACGATAAGVDLLLSGKADIVFNPSGGYHHAAPQRASGFCYLNDVGLACQLLTEAGKRVLYLDVDVHHGDGVQDFFYDRKDVLTVSLHESGKKLFPGTGFENDIGTGVGKGYSVNVPLPPGTFDEVYMSAFREIVPPLIRLNDPDVIVLELGMDALSGDPLADLELTNNTYGDVLHEVMKFKKPLLATGGGGYHVRNTVRGWALIWSIMTDRDHSEELSAGMGGILMESTEWQGGLRDRRIVQDVSSESEIRDRIEQTVQTVRKNIFPYHETPAE